MRAGTEIDEFAILKECNLFTFRNVINALQLIGLVDGLVILLGFVAGFL